MDIDRRALLLGTAASVATAAMPVIGATMLPGFSPRTIVMTMEEINPINLLLMMMGDLEEDA